MSRRKKLLSAGFDDPGLTVTALIDVSFLLLIYFLVTSTIQKEEHDLGLTLPTMNGPSPPVEIPVLEIRIQPGGEIFIMDQPADANGASRQLPILKQRLAIYQRAADFSKQTPIVLIDADDTSRNQRLVDVLNCLAEAEITNVMLRGFRE